MENQEDCVYTVVTEEKTHYFGSFDSFCDFMEKNGDKTIVSIEKHED